MILNVFIDNEKYDIEFKEKEIKSSELIEIIKINESRL